jgi:hypothetical protein
MHTNAGTQQKLAKHVNARWWVGEKKQGKAEGRRLQKQK